MRKSLNKSKLEKELKSLFKSMDFVSNNFLKKGKKYSRLYFNIYQQLGIAWEFLGLQCKHWNGYKKIKKGGEICKMCGKIKGANELYYLISKGGLKKIGERLKPNSKKTFKNKREAGILDDTIDFYGARLGVDVHNSYKTKLLKNEINMAAERIVSLTERGIKCKIDPHLVYVEVNNTGGKIGKKRYGGFPWEIKYKNLTNFPVLFDFDENYQLLGLSILR